MFFQTAPSSSYVLFVYWLAGEIIPLVRKPTHSNFKNINGMYVNDLRQTLPIRPLLILQLDLMWSSNRKDTRPNVNATVHFILINLNYVIALLPRALRGPFWLPRAPLPLSRAPLTSSDLKRGLKRIFNPVKHASLHRPPFIRHSKEYQVPTGVDN